MPNLTAGTLLAILVLIVAIVMIALQTGSMAILGMIAALAIARLVP